MKYYYLHPWNPRFFFPKGVKRHPLFLSICRPYSLPARLSLMLFRHLPLYHRLFTKSSIEAFVPENEIRALIGNDALLAFNAGTPGPEQKPTALGYENGEYFFLKYAHTPLAVKNVSNEHEVLLKIADLDFVPQVIGFHESKQGALLKTSVVQGASAAPLLTEAVVDILFRFAKQDSSEKDGLRYGFAHGDFCPWNMVQQDRKIFVFDWEMAGNYPLGYDLFTFIFQTAFLLTPQKNIEEVIGETRPMINRFFARFGISDWAPYLRAFAQVKVDYISTQGDKGLLDAYSHLLKFSQD